MDIKIVKAGALHTNCYVVTKDTKCFVVDCGGDEVCDFLIENGISDVTVLLTHGHFDHTAGIENLRKKIKDVKVYAIDEEKDVVENDINNCSHMFGEKYKVSDVLYLHDNDTIDVLGLSIKVIHTPGHTKGSCCYYVKDESVLFSGDTLFYHSSGRTDLYTGNIRDIVVSIGKKLMALPDDTVVYPGHDKSTTIAEERKVNDIVKTYNMRKDWDQK